MDYSVSARANAIPFEAKKDSLRQRQDGTWVIGLVVAAVDMDSRITAAAMGTRFQCVLVEINDDETPVDHKAMERDKWKELKASAQAALRCKEPVFRAYLNEERGFNVADEEGAAQVVRGICGVASRSELNKPGQLEARIQWHKLDFDYQAWRAANA